MSTDTDGLTDAQRVELLEGLKGLLEKFGSKPVVEALGDAAESAADVAEGRAGRMFRLVALQMRVAQSAVVTAEIASAAEGEIPGCITLAMACEVLSEGFDS